MPLLALDLESKTPVTVLVTNGLRNYEMPVHEKYKGREFNELYFCLPSYWEWEDLDNPQMNWVFHWIQRLVRYVRDKETWFGPGHTMPCGADMQPLSATMKQNHLMIADPILLETEMTPIKVDGKMVHFLAIIPIFGEEMDFKQARGTFKLMQKFTNKGVTENLDDFRSSALSRRWSFRR